MGSILDFMKPICFFGNRNKKNNHKKRQQNGHKDEKKEQLLKNNYQLTLQDCILSSPSLNKSSPLPSASSSKRVYPDPPFVNENVSTETLLLGDSWNPLFENNNDVDDMGMITRKKRVSFRMPEVADIFILAASPESPDRQACGQL